MSTDPHRPRPALAPAVASLVPALGVVLCTRCRDRGAPSRLAAWSTPDRTRHYCGFCKLEAT